MQRNIDDTKAMLSEDITQRHCNPSHKLENSFIQGISNTYTEDGKQKSIRMLEPVKNPQYVPGAGCKKEVPFAFVAVAGNTPMKK